MRGLILFGLIGISGIASAQGLDRDTLLADAPATPVASTIRIAGLGNAHVEGDETSSIVSGQVMWAPFENFAIDGGAYWQSGQGAGPAARMRYQILSQEGVGIDLAAGLRYKMIGFHTDRSELEFIVAGGRQIGAFDLILNGVFGVETEGGGKDIEVKGFVGRRFGETLRAGIDARLASEVEDEEAEALPKVGREFDLTVGPAVSWSPDPAINFQALIGLAAPRKTDRVGPAGILSASIDF